MSAWKSDISRALWFAGFVTAIAEAGLLMLRLPMEALWSHYFALSAALATPGMLAAVFLTGFAEYYSHGGRISFAILVIATPINLFVYGALAWVVIKVGRKLRTH